MDARTLLLRAQALAESGQHAEARADVAEAHRLGAPLIEDETAWLQIGAAAMKRSDVAEAERCLDEAIALTPTPHLHLMRARSRAVRGDIVAAEADHRAAVALDPELVAQVEAANGPTLGQEDHEEALRLSAIGMNADALGVLLRVRAIDDEKARYEAIAGAALEGLAGHYLRGRAAYEADLIQVAEREAATAYALAPSSGPVGELFVRVLLERGDAEADDDAAEACYERARGVLDAMDAVPWLTYESRILRALTIERLGSFDDAIAVLDDLVATWPDRPDAYVIRGRWRADDDPEAARRDLARAEALRR